MFLYINTHTLLKLAEQSEPKSPKSRDGSLKNRLRQGRKKRLSMTVRDSKAGPLPKDWSVFKPTLQLDEIEKLKHENELLNIKVDELTTRYTPFEFNF